MIRLINISKTNKKNDINNIKFGKFDELSPLHRRTNHDFHGNDELNGLNDILYQNDKIRKSNAFSQMHYNSLSNPFESIILCVVPLTSLRLATTVTSDINTCKRNIYHVGGPCADNKKQQIRFIYHNLMLIHLWYMLFSKQLIKSITNLLGTVLWSLDFFFG